MLQVHAVILDTQTGKYHLRYQRSDVSENTLLFEEGENVGRAKPASYLKVSELMNWGIVQA